MSKWQNELLTKAVHRKKIFALLKFAKAQPPAPIFINNKKSLFKLRFRQPASLDRDYQNRKRNNS